VEKKIPLKKEAYDKLEAQAKAVGKTPDELASEIVLEKATAETGEPGENKPKAKRERKLKAAQPVEPNNGKQPFVNAYGFVHLNSKLMTVIDAKKGKKTPIVIDVQGDTLMIKKAA
jgi:hypothetical protein